MSVVLILIGLGRQMEQLTDHSLLVTSRAFVRKVVEIGFAPFVNMVITNREYFATPVVKVKLVCIL